MSEVICIGLGGGTEICIGLGGLSPAKRTEAVVAAAALADALGTYSEVRES